MKTLLSLVLFVFALSAKAGNEGAQAAPGLPNPTVLAECIEFTGFMAPPDYPINVHYQILTDGTVQVQSWKRNQKDPEVRVLKKLSQDKVAQIDDLVQSIEPGEMVDPNPGAPPCMDGGSRKYVVYSLEGEITIAETIACKKMIRPNATEADEAMIVTLNSVKKLANKK
jgi:hypothetical protein